MAIIRNNFVKPNEDEIRDLDFNRLYLLVGGNAVKLSTIWVDTVDGYRKLTDSRDFFELQNGNGYIYTDSHGSNAVDLTGSREHDAIEAYINDNIRYATNVVVPSSYETAEIVALRDGNDLQPRKGMQRSVSTIEATDMSEQAIQNNYILVQIQGNPWFEYVKRSDIYHYDGERQVQSFMQFGRVNDVVRENVEYYINGQLIENIYSENEYVFDRLISYEDLDFASGEHRFYETIESDGTIQPELVHVEPFEVFQSEQTPTDDDKIKIRNFQLSNSGEYINVLMQGQSVEEKVKLTELYAEDGQPIFNEQGEAIHDLIDLIGQSLRIRLSDGSFRQTEALTTEQVQLRYEVIRSLQKTEAEEDVLADGTYLKTEDGRYIEEKTAVQPICYNFADNDEEFQAYFVLVGSGDKERYVVINKSEFDVLSRGRDSFNLEGEIVNVKSARKLKRASLMTNCDVLQTTHRGTKIEECKHYKKIDKENVLEHAKELEIQRQAFVEAYRRGQYPIQETIDENGKIVQLGDTRYKFTDEYTLDDPISTSSEYEGLKEKDVSLVQKDGKLVAVKGGPKYDVNKAISKKLGTVAGGMFTGLARVGAIGGFFLVPALPVIIPAFAAGLAGALVTIPAYCGIKGAIVNKTKDHFKNPVDIRRNSTKKDIEKTMVELYDMTLEHMASRDMTQEKASSAEKIFLQEMEKIDRMIIELSRTTDRSTFAFKDGKCKFETHNAHAVGEFAEATQRQLDELKSLEKKVKKAKDKKDAFEKARVKIEARRNQYGALSQKDQRKLDKLIREQGGSVAEYETLQQRRNSLQATVEGRTTDFVSEPIVNPADPRQEELIRRAKAMKGFMMLKYFNDSNVYELEEDELALLETLEFNPKKGTFINKETKYEFTLAQIQNQQLQRDANIDMRSSTLQDVLFRLTSKMQLAGEQTFDINNPRFVMAGQRSITQSISEAELPIIESEVIAPAPEHLVEHVATDDLIDEDKEEQVLDNGIAIEPLLSSPEAVVNPEPTVPHVNESVLSAEARRQSLLSQISTTQSEIAVREQNISQTESSIQVLERLEGYLAKCQQALGIAEDEMLVVDAEHKELMNRLTDIEEQLKNRPEDEALVREHNNLVVELESKGAVLQEKIDASNRRWNELQEAKEVVERDKAEQNIRFESSEEAREYLASQQAEKQQLEEEQARLEQELQDIENEIKKQQKEKDELLFNRDMLALEERMHGQEDKVTKLRYLEDGLREIAKFQDELEEKLANASTDEERAKIQAVISQVDALANKCRELTEMVQAQPDAVEASIVEAQSESSNGGGAKSTRAPKVKASPTETKTRLSKPALEKLLQQIEKLGELDRLYYGADEEIPSDIEYRLGQLESKIRPNVHLLKKASKNPNYGIYLSRIIDAENILKQYKLGKNEKIKISDGLEI